MDKIDETEVRYTLLLTREFRKRIGIAAARAEQNLADWCRDALLEQLARDEKKEILERQKAETH